MLVPLVVAVVANATPRLYSALLVKKLHLDVHSEDKFLMTLENAIAFLIVIGLQVLSSYMDRKCRLFVYYPIIMFLICDIFPFVVIMKNALMEKMFKVELSRSFQSLVKPCLLILNYTKRSNEVYPV